MRFFSFTIYEKAQAQRLGFYVQSIPNLLKHNLCVEASVFGGDF